MVTERDKAWSKSQGERRSEVAEEKEKKSLADRVKEKFIEGAEVRALTQGLGDQGVLKEGEEIKEEHILDKIRKIQQDKLAAQAATEILAPKEQKPVEQPISIKAQFDLAEMMKTEKELRQKAEERGDVWLGKYFSSMADAVKEQVNSLRSLVDQRFQQQQGQASPLDTYRQIKAEIDEIKKELSGGLPAQGVSPEVLVRLKEMELNQTLQLRKMDKDAEEHRDKMLLEMRKWEDERKLRWADWREKKETKSKTLTELGELVGSVVESMGEGEEPSPVRKTMAFECPTCQEKLRAKAGQENITCPTCGETHQLDWGGEESPEK